MLRQVLHGVSGISTDFVCASPIRLTWLGRSTALTRA